MRKYGLSLLAALFTAGILYGSTRVSEDMLAAWVERVGILGPAALAAYYLTSHIIAPLSGSLAFFTGVRIYGYVPAMFFFYVVSLCSSIVNFWIAKKYGREGVKKVVGERALERIDSISHEDEMRLLIVSRLFGYYLFDFTSYALGLTKLRFRRYFVVTATLSLIPMTGYYALLHAVDFSTGQGILLYYCVLAVSGTVLASVLYIALQKSSAKP
jgi:uncharacterized membrane protein YdjX (TVP38/TMEM64 family)